jgi:hypothetical protein
MGMESFNTPVPEENKTEQETQSSDKSSESLKGFDNYDGSKTAEDIREYEKENNINQDILIQSWLTHTDIYKNIQEKARVARENYDVLVKSNESENQAVVEAKEDWDNANSELRKEEEIMNPMLQYLTKETLRKYKENLRQRGIVSEEILSQL